MHSEIAQFLRFLDVERNASDLTIKSYREDLMDMADFLTEEKATKLLPREVTPTDLRGYVAALHEATPSEIAFDARPSSLPSRSCRRG